MNRFLAGVGRALIIYNNQLIGVAKTLTDSTLDFTITSEDIRGGNANKLFGKYFHDSNLAITLTDPMFHLEYMALSLGTTVQSGGLSIKEEQVTASGGVITASETPITTGGTTIGWYKLPTDEMWQVGTFSGKNISISGATDNDVYCLKYFYENENGRSIVINADYVPQEVHLVLINDEFNGDIATDPANTSKIGRLITDIPRFQFEGNQNLSLTSAGAASQSLSGNALAVSNTTSCEDEDYYGTMTEEIFGEVWQDRVIALAIADAELDLANSESATLSVYAVFGGGMASAKKDNSNFTFTVQSGTSATVTSGGVVTADASTDGVTVIEVSLTGYASVSPAYVYVTVA